MTADIPVKIPAAAKINLYLHVTGVRDDGYHTLDSLIAFAAIHDTLTVAPALDMSLTILGPYAGGLSAGQDNLVLRAANSLRQASGYEGGCAITLEKTLPVAAGIGGGSADAAAVLDGLMRLWNLDRGALDLGELALSLGADVPVCLFGQAAYIGGIGEIITPAAALPETGLVLINPGVAVSTPAVFKARQDTAAGSTPGHFDTPPATASELAANLATRNNDLCEAAIGLQPVIGEVLEELERCEDILLARMSGSGATCFGLFANAEDALLAAAELSRRHPKWWVRPTSLISDTGTLAA